MSGSGDEDVTRQFQPQKSQTQAASRNPRAAGIAGADSGGAVDAGARPFARGRPRQADRRGLRGIRQSRAAQRRHPARSDLVGRDDVEIGGLYPRLRRRHRPQLRHPARQPAGQSALDHEPADRRQATATSSARPTTSSSASTSATASYLKKARETRGFVFSDYLFARITDKPIVMAAYPVSAIKRRGGFGRSSPASVSTGCRRSWAISAAGPALRRC